VALSPEAAAERIAALERALAEALWKVEGLEIALESRDVIGQAKGILMERGKVDAEKAFDQLVAMSQERNEKLRDVAGRIAAGSPGR
jgi:AmiR/NasT family two-component response regulator